MNGFLVTRKENIVFNEQGLPEFTEEGELQLINENDVGILVKTHTIPINQVNPETNTLTSGFVSRSEVFWDERRNPSPAMEDPNDLFWISVASSETEEEDETEEGEEGENLTDADEHSYQNEEYADDEGYGNKSYESEIDQ